MNHAQHQHQPSTIQYGPYYNNNNKLGYEMCPQLRNDDYDAANESCTNIEISVLNMNLMFVLTHINLIRNVLKSE